MTVVHEVLKNTSRKRFLPYQISVINSLPTFPSVLNVWHLSVQFVLNICGNILLVVSGGRCDFNQSVSPCCLVMHDLIKYISWFFSANHSLGSFNFDQG